MLLKSRGTKCLNCGTAVTVSTGSNSAVAKKESFVLLTSNEELIREPGVYLQKMVMLKKGQCERIVFGMWPLIGPLGKSHTQKWTAGGKKWDWKAKPKCVQSQELSNSFSVTGYTTPHVQAGKLSTDARAKL